MYQSNYLELKARRDALLANRKPHSHSRGNSRPVICVETGERWPSTADATRKLRLHYNRIPDAIAKNGKVKVKGAMLTFRYEEEA